ncbi:hypothetical protein PCASD_10289 [Puccinia coronata f. sp. avenae]|uniref:Uncharacterized protein n=1 Tax=Puccinia coronata f. sp. avenae TaxID=200324 RepID=A0A2N5U7L3_9BASI|nr:hypothetical protein PCASD_10289 [Puccinia coronata f. sp. avenae]
MCLVADGSGLVNDQEPSLPVARDVADAAAASPLSCTRRDDSESSEYTPWAFQPLRGRTTSSGAPVTAPKYLSSLRP